MKRFPASAVLLATICTACSTAAVDDGMETGPCVDGLCFSGLVCSAGVCVQGPEDDDDGDPTSGITTTPVTSSSTTAGDPSTTGPTGAASMSASTDRTSDETTSEAVTTDESLTSSGEDSTSHDPTIGFIAEPDVVPGAIECSTWTQNCPAGEKCNAWANDGGNSWNATRCVDIVNNPDDVGEVCSVEGSGVSGSDSCVEGAICWNVDAETNLGECVAYCSGSELAPQCPGDTVCVVSNGGVLPLCHQPCDPLAQNCPATEACYLVGDAFVCSPDASGTGGFAGDPCEFINVCNPGLGCVNADALPNCFGVVGCCTPFCDVDAPACAAGLDCVAIFEVGQAPPGQDDVGYCALSP